VCTSQGVVTSQGVYFSGVGIPQGVIPQGGYTLGCGIPQGGLFLLFMVGYSLLLPMVVIPFSHGGYSLSPMVGILSFLMVDILLFSPWWVFSSLSMVGILLSLHGGLFPLPLRWVIPVSLLVLCFMTLCTGFKAGLCPVLTSGYIPVSLLVVRYSSLFRQFLTFLTVGSEPRPCTYKVDNPGQDNLGITRNNGE